MFDLLLTNFYFTFWFFGTSLLLIGVGWNYWNVVDTPSTIRKIACIIIPPLGWYLLCRITLEKWTEDVDKDIAGVISIFLTLGILIMMSTLMGVGVLEPSAVVLAAIYHFSIPLLILVVMVRDWFRRRGAVVTDEPVI